MAIQDANTGALSGGTTASYQYGFPYINPTPVDTTGEDTGLFQASLPPNTHLTGVATFTLDGIVNAVTQDAKNDIMPLYEDIHRVRGTPAVEGQGFIKFDVWLDSVTKTYWYSLSTQGGGVTLNTVAINTETLINT